METDGGDEALPGIDEAEDHLADPDEYWDRLFLRASRTAGLLAPVSRAYGHGATRLRDRDAEPMVRTRRRRSDAPDRIAAHPVRPGVGTEGVPLRSCADRR